MSLPFYHWANAIHTLGIFSVLGVSSCVKSPTPGTTIILSPGAWAISSLESRSASSCLLEGTAGKSFQFWGSGTVMSLAIFRHIFKLSLTGFCEYYFWWTCQCSDQMSHLSYWKISQKQVHVQQIHQLDRQMSASAGFPIATEDVVGLLFGLPEKLWQVVAVLFYHSHLSFYSLYSDLNVDSELDFGNRSLNLTVAAFTSLSSSNVYNCDCPSSSMLKWDSRISGVATSLIAILWRDSMDPSSGVNTLKCSCIFTLLLVSSRYCFGLNCPSESWFWQVRLHCGG